MFTIMTDSAADLNADWVAENKVIQLGLTVQLNGQTYQTFGPNQLDNDFLFQEMKTGAQPRTSQVNVGQFEEAYQNEVQVGHDVLFVGLSSALSGTYQSAVIARDMVLQNNPDAKIEVIDSLGVSAGQGLLVQLAVQARQEQKTLVETMEILEAASPRIRSYIVVDDLDHLVRGGRLSKSSAIFGTLANIKPILHITKEGSIAPISKIRGRKRAIKELIKLILQDLASDHVSIGYTGSSDSAAEMKEALLTESAVKKVSLFEIGPVIAAHLGPDSLALFSFGKQPR